MKLTETPLIVRINTHGGDMPEQHGEWIDLKTAEDAVLIAQAFNRFKLYRRLLLH